MTLSKSIIIYTLTACSVLLMGCNSQIANQSNVVEDQQMNSASVQDPNIDQITDVVTDGFRTHTNSFGGFTFKYPATWVSKQIQTNLLALNPLDDADKTTDLLTVEIVSDSYAGYLTHNQSELQILSRETIRNRAKTGTLEKGVILTADDSTEENYYTQYTLPLGNSETLVFFLHDDNQVNIDMMLEMIDSLVLTEQQNNEYSAYQSLQRFENDSLCFTFIQQRHFIDPSLNLNIQNVSALQALAVDWDWGHICESMDNSDIFVLAVNKSVAPGENKIELINDTLKIYPSAEELIALDNSYTDYQFYYYVDRNTNINFDSINHSLKSGELVPITELAWSEVLASCSIEPGNFIADQGVIISCGSGDNGCAQVERVKWNLLTGEHTYLSACSNNCDLANDESYVFECKI